MFALACLAFIQKAEAVSPAPDGGYPGGNTAEGQNALFSLSSGAYNTALGFLSLRSNTTGSLNTAIGAGTLLLNTGEENTATGAAALLSNTTGAANTANGSRTLLSNTTGNSNTATGVFALLHNTTGSFNTANGVDALDSNTIGSFNTASGFDALLNNIDGTFNTASGYQALYFNTAGRENTATGYKALYFNTTGIDNTASGYGALFSNTEGSNNIAMGFGAGSNVTTANHVIAIGAIGANVSDSCFIDNIYSNVQPVIGIDPDYVTVTSTGRLGRANVSSRRYKHDIEPMAKASEVLYALKPVSFRYHKEYDATQTVAFGLIAEEVAEVYPDLVGRNTRGQPESVRYDQINAMLLNEFLKEHKKVQALEVTVARQQKGMETLTALLKEQAAQIQKVSVQLATAGPSRGGLEASKPAPQLVNNP